MSEIPFLISLLDDPSEEVFQSVRRRIFELGYGVVAELEKKWEQEDNPIQQERIALIIDELEFVKLRDDFSDWVKSRSGDLLIGAWLVDRVQFPGLKLGLLQVTVDKITREIWLNLTDYLTPVEKIRVVNKVLFNSLGFKATEKGRETRNDLSISHLLQSKVGGQHSLAILYLMITQKLGFPVHGTACKQFAMLGFADEPLLTTSPAGESVNNVLFYIYPYGSGTVYGKKYLESQANNPEAFSQKPNFEPLSNLSFFKMYMGEVLEFFKKSQSNSKAVKIAQLLRDFS